MLKSNGVFWSLYTVITMHRSIRYQIPWPPCPQLQCRGSALDHPRANLPTEHIKLFGCELHKHINMVRASRGVPRHILLLLTFFECLHLSKYG